MTMSRQLITLAGGLAAIVILALGIVLVALPMFGQAKATDQQADEIAQTNDIYEIQVQTLRAQEAELPALESELADLRGQIPATALNDQVYELVGRAADSTGVEVVSVAAAAPEAWTAAAAPAADGGTAEAPATETPAPETPADEAPAGEAPAPDAAAQADVAAGGDAAGTASGAETPAAPGPEADPQQAVPITITVTTEDAAQAARFIDAVRGATRLLSIEHAVLTEEEEGFRLVVNARSLLLAQK